MSATALTGWTPIEVQAENLENVRVLIRPSVNITGRIQIETRTANEATLALSRIRVGLRRDLDILGLPALMPTPSATEAPAIDAPGSDGGFDLRGISAGEYWVTVTSIPDGSYVKAIRMGQQDLLTTPIHIDGQPEGFIEITVAVDGGTIDGLVVDEKQSPVPNSTVVIVPDSQSAQRADRFRSVVTDAEGRFRAVGIVPGTYSVFAWESMDDTRWQNAEFMRNFEGKGTISRIDPGVHVTTVIPVMRDAP
jgi:hypothetical protein